MTDPRAGERDVFGRLRGAAPVWAVASIHGDVQRLTALHDRLAGAIGATDRVVYLGNYLGVGGAPAATLDELLTFRRWLLARPGAFACDVAYLRGAQEEMWTKLLQVQFATDPTNVLRWLIDHGAEATVRAYGGNIEAGLRAAREGAMALTRWTSALRQAMAAHDGHQPLISHLKRAAFTDDGALLFVHAGLDVHRPLAEQRDSFWWASRAFAQILEPYQGYARIVRGFDPDHPGLIVTDHTLTIDFGCGFGGPLAAVRLDDAGQVTAQLEA